MLTGHSTIIAAVEYTVLMALVYRIRYIHIDTWTSFFLLSLCGGETRALESRFLTNCCPYPASNSSLLVGMAAWPCPLMRKRINSYESQQTLYSCRQRTAFHVHTGQLLRNSFAEYRQGLSSVEKKHALEGGAVRCCSITQLNQKSFAHGQGRVQTLSGGPMFTETYS